MEKMGSFQDREYEARLGGKERGGDAEAKDALNGGGKEKRLLWKEDLAERMILQ